jgi:hypothetical protein
MIYICQIFRLFLRILCHQSVLDSWYRDLWFLNIMVYMGIYCCALWYHKHGRGAQHKVSKFLYFMQHGCFFMFYKIVSFVPTNTQARCSNDFWRLKLVFFADSMLHRFFQNAENLYLFCWGHITEMI